MVSDPEIFSPNPFLPLAVPLVKFWNVPPLSDAVVDRPEELAALRESLLRSQVQGRTLIDGVIQGQGGSGKTVLAQLLARDRQVRAHFPDGIYWLSLGPEPDVLALLADLIRIFDPAFRPSQIPEASAHLQGLLSESILLLILDDVRDKEHSRPFLVGGEQCRLLVTTRHRYLAEDPDARLFPLDVMTPGQALALFENSLARTFDATESRQALELATTVGFLPLTLHLAIMGMPEGVSWQAWRGELQEEIARLNALEGAKRLLSGAESQVSLEAALRLSSGVLSSDTPQTHARFAWLGVTPENAILTPPMMAVVWQMDVEGTQVLLELLRRKALLLAAAPMTIGERIYPCFRMHALLHARARRLLSAEPPAGLGLSSTEAHRLLLEYYRERLPQRGAGGWASLPDDGYIYDHLTWHMEGAGQFEAMLLLLKEETEEGKNAWFERKDRFGKTASYIADVRRSWRGVQRRSQEAYERGESIGTLGLELRHCLILTSLNSLAASLPMKMIVGFVRKGVWPPRVGLTYILGMPNDTHRAQWLGSIAPYLTGGQVREALAAVRTMEDVPGRQWALELIAGQWIQPDEGLQLAVDEPSLVWSIKDAFSLSEVSDPSLSEALAGIAGALAAIGNTEQALTVVRIIAHEKKRAVALIDILRYLSEAELHEALSIADTGYRVYSVVEIAKEWVVRGNTEQAFSIVRTHEHAPEWFLADLIPSLTEEQLREALTIAQTMDGALYRVCAFIQIGIRRKHPEARAQMLADALALIPTIESPPLRAQALTKIAPDLTEKQLYTALTIAWTVEGAHFCAPTVAEIAIHMRQPAETLREAIRIAQTIEYPSQRAWTLTEIAMCLTLPEERAQVLADALVVARTNGDAHRRAQALIGIAGKLNQGAERTQIAVEALALAQKIGNARECSQAIIGLLPYLTQEQLQEAESTALTIAHAPFSGQALVEIVKAHIALGDAGQALSTAQAIEDAFRRSQALTEVAPYLPQAEERARGVAEALSSAQAVEDPYFRAMALADAAVGLQYVPFEYFYPLWTGLMQQIVLLKREEAQRTVARLSAALLENGSSQTGEELLLALSDVARWWL